MGSMLKQILQDGVENRKGNSIVAIKSVAPYEGMREIHIRVEIPNKPMHASYMIGHNTLLESGENPQKMESTVNSLYEDLNKQWLIWYRLNLDDSIKGLIGSAFQEYNNLYR